MLQLQYHPHCTVYISGNLSASRSMCIYWLIIISYLSWTGLRGPIACSLLGGGVPTHNRGYRDTIICPYIVLLYYRSFPCLQCHPGVSSCAATSPHLYSSPPESAADLSFPPSISIPSCPHHRRETKSPVLQTDRSQRSRIGRVVIYCATVF